jgi:hypothetical protein
MRSVSLALLGAVVYGVLTTALVSGVWGTVGAGRQNVIVFSTLILLIVIAARVRRENFIQLAGHQT